ncbi:hypothetical protein [Kitasatospora sp. NPDC056800]
MPKWHRTRWGSALLFLALVLEIGAHGAEVYERLHELLPHL